MKPISSFSTRGLLFILLYIPSILAAQGWLNDSSGTLYYNQGDVIIGHDVAYTINPLTPFFVEKTPQLSLRSNYPVPESFFEIRNTSATSAAALRRVGLLFKLSSEGSVVESNKMGGIVLESQLEYANTPSLHLVTYNAKRLSIMYDGKVGIGTTTPIYQLDVTGGARLRKAELSTVAGTAKNSWVRDTWLTSNLGNLAWDEANGVWKRGANTYNDFGGIVFQDEGTYFIREKAGSKLEFTNSEFLNTAYLFANMSNGYVGIGTTSPDSRLTVKGTIHTQEVKVDLNGSVAPDFVFEEDYALPRLAETELFIRTNKHLPGIPSGQEMEEHGIDLKEMNLKLLQKVEELTLYLIEQERNVAELKREVRKLKEEIAK